MGEPQVPPGSVVRDDGCICPPTARPPEKECEIKLSTCPYDPRFPNQNQTKRCYFSFVDYQRCARLLGNYPGCQYFLRCYRALCPNSWQETWFEQMEKNTFPRKIYPPKPIVRPDDQKKDWCAEEDLEEEGPSDIC